MLQICSDKPKAQIAKVTPDMARLILEECNHRNRHCDPRRVAMYTEEMTSGRWMFTGEAVKVSRDGRLLDGQHRLHAIIEANASLSILVITGLDPRAQEVMDQGMPRSLADALHLLFSAADVVEADAFTDALLTGHGGTPAARAIRDRLVTEYENSSHEHPRAHIKTRTLYIVQAWNAGDGQVPEFHADGFPGIRGLDLDLADSRHLSVAA